MSSIKDPTQKKTKSLQKDHRTFPLEGDKSFRGLWRKKKRMMAKKERRAADSVLREACEQDREDMGSPQRQVPRSLHKTSTVRLKDAIEISKDRGTRFSCFSYFKGV